jgi:hypothetical protein
MTTHFSTSDNTHTPKKKERKRTPSRVCTRVSNDKYTLQKYHHRRKKTFFVVIVSFHARASSFLLFAFFGSGTLECIIGSFFFPASSDILRANP